MEVVSSVQLNVLWKGQPDNYFATKKCIRQGEPICHLLFVLCMEKLSHLISEVVEDGTWKSIKAYMCSKNMPFNVCWRPPPLWPSPCLANASGQAYFGYFCGMSGQRINVNKSTIFFSKNTLSSCKHHILQRTGMKETKSVGIHHWDPPFNW